MKYDAARLENNRGLKISCRLDPLSLVEKQRRGSRVDALTRAGITAKTLVLAHGWGWRTIKIADIERIIAGAKGGRMGAVNFMLAVL